MNLMIVEDEAAIREGVSEFLRSQGYFVWEAADGQEALDLFGEVSVDLVLLDIMMPKKNGFEVLAEIRKTSTVPVLMLTAVADEEAQIKTFDLLVDGYIQEPFSLALLAKRIEALLKRHYGEFDIWEYKDSKVNFSSYEATYKGEVADTKPKELAVLKLLLDHQGQVLSRAQILDHVWANQDDPPFDRVVDVYIKQLRKNLGLDCIVTVKNVGYKLELK